MNDGSRIYCERIIYAAYPPIHQTSPTTITPLLPQFGCHMSTEHAALSNYVKRVTSDIQDEDARRFFEKNKNHVQRAVSDQLFITHGRHVGYAHLAGPPDNEFDRDVVESLTRSYARRYPSRASAAGGRRTRRTRGRGRSTKPRRPRAKRATRAKRGAGRASRTKRARGGKVVRGG